MTKKYTITATTYDKRGRVLSVGKNSYTRTHPVQKHFASKAGEQHKIFIHAEISALLKAGNRKVDKIKIERYDSDGNPKNASPCKICRLALKTWGVKFVEHTI